MSDDPSARITAALAAYQEARSRLDGAEHAAQEAGGEEWRIRQIMHLCLPVEATTETLVAACVE